jgi:(2R)-ethylmalonyl-CoA mutase
MREAGIGGTPVVVGGIVPEEDVSRLKAAGVARVYTPKDYDITRIMGELVDLIESSRPHAA